MKAKRKIMKTKPEVTDEEIRGFMNFDKLLSENSALELKRRYVSRLLWGGLAILLLAGLGTASYWSFQNATDKNIQSTHEPITPIKEQPEEKIKDQILQDKQELSASDKKEEKPKANQEKASVKNPEVITKDSASLPPSVYKEAEPVAGFPHLYEYFNIELKYPTQAVKDSIQGIVTVSFIIGKDGKPEEVKIIHSLGAPFDKEVYRLIEHMPAWKPATMNDRPMRAKISLPLTFRLEKGK